MPCLTPAAWAARETPPQDHLLGELLSTSVRVLFAADTGLGKTMFSLSLALGLHLGKGFLHWQGKRKARVLYLDGEMPVDLIKERIVQECARWDVDPADITDGLYILSREDVEDMPPLDTPEGLAWLLELIESVGGVDLVVFDNLMCLTQGDLREETTWTALKPVVLELTKRRIGQWWVHHVGHDKTRPYGSKPFQWMMDLVLLGEAVPGHRDADVAFKLTFQKARRRTPDNRTDFQDTTIVLQDGQWSSQEAPADTFAGRRPAAINRVGALAAKALDKALAAAGERLPDHEMTRGVTQAVQVRTWRTYFAQIAGYGDTPKEKEAERKAFDRGRENLLGAGGAAVWGPWAWRVGDL